MSQPNILIIHCDQLRFDCLGFNGNPDIQTPHLDCLAKDSVNYNNHYTVYPICTPSRYSFWSSLYVHQHGAWDNHATLPGGCPTFPKVLRENGYRTAAVGKMHMNPVYQDIGFSHMELAEQNGTGRFQDDYHRWLMERGKIDRFDLHHQSDLFREETTDHLYDMCQCAQSDLALENDSTEWITRRAKEQIECWEDGTPSVLMVGYRKQKTALSGGFLRYEGWSWNSGDRLLCTKEKRLKSTRAAVCLPCYVVVMISFS